MALAPPATVAIHQPQYLPWLAYLDKIDQADLFVYLDTVQFQKRGLQHRNSIHGQNEPLLLTVPVASSRSDRICDVRIADDERWARRHVASLRHAYASARERARLEPLQQLLERPWSLLVELAIATTEWLCDAYGITTPRRRASELGDFATLHKDDLIIAVTQAAGGARYLSGGGARVYQDPEKFRRAGIELAYQIYERMPYPQGFAGFEDALSAVDAVAHVADPRAVLIAGRRPAAPASIVHAEAHCHEQV